MKKYIGSIDQGTTSTRFILFTNDGEIAFSSQKEHKQYYPNPGWVEHDADEIWTNTLEVIYKTLKENNIKADEIEGIGITNQRETTIAFNPKTGEVYHNAIVWQDLRTNKIVDDLKKKMSKERLNEITGLVFSPYFVASKIMWMLENIEGLKAKVETGDCIFGTIDTFLTYKLTGEIITDVTNASRYMLMDLKTLSWSDELLSLCSIDKKALPEIKASIGEIYGHCSLFGSPIPVCGILGDQQAALFGQVCFSQGEAKCTYGTGCFMLVNTGEEIAYSTSGLLTTLAYQIKGEKPNYALEGSVAIAGSLVQWTRDNLKMVKNAKELDELASEVENCAGIYIVPAFSGLYAPHWRSDARGIIAGLTGYITRNHICRAVLESTAYQANDIFEVMEKESNIKLKSLKVDGGLTNSRPLMEFQADILSLDVIRPAVVETTALGAAYAAGLTVGCFKDLPSLTKYWKEDKRWKANMEEKERNEKIFYWRKAVSRTLNWSSEENNANI